MFGTTGIVKEDLYRGAQADVVARGSGALSVVGAVAALALAPFYPPTAEIGAVGWALVVALAVASLVLGVLRVTLKLHPSLAETRAASFIGVGQVALLQWLAGGGRAPYIQLLLLPTLGAAASQSVRCCVCVLVAAVAVAVSPILYSTIDVGATATEFSLLSVMTLMMAIVIASTRSHRAHLKDAHKHADELAHVDVLTGLLNRRAFDEVLASERESAIADGRPISVLLCDVNSFKQINDTFGHRAGDEALRSIATALSDAVRAPDAAFRWAGDEFAVILRDTDEQSAVRVGVRLRDAVTRRCKRPDGRAITIGTGTAQLQADMSTDELLAKADIALLSQKGHQSHLRGVA